MERKTFHKSYVILILLEGFQILWIGQWEKNNHFFIFYFLQFSAIYRLKSTFLKFPFPPRFFSSPLLKRDGRNGFFMELSRRRPLAHGWLIFLFCLGIFTEIFSSVYILCKFVLIVAMILHTASFLCWLWKHFGCFFFVIVFVDISLFARRTPCFCAFVSVCVENGGL